MKTLRTGFSRLREDELDDAAEKVHTALNGNTNFPTTTPTLAQLATGTGNYREALAMPPGQARTAAVAARRAELEGLLSALASNLNLVPNVTEEMLATTGFEFRKDSVRTGADVDAPADVRVKPSGMSGELEVRCKPVDRARSYQLQYTQNAQSTLGGWRHLCQHPRNEDRQPRSRGGLLGAYPGSRRQRRRAVERPGHGNGDLKEAQSGERGCAGGSIPPAAADARVFEGGKAEKLKGYTGVSGRRSLLVPDG